MLLKHPIFRASFLCWGHSHLRPDELLRLCIISSLFLAKLFPVTSPKRAMMIWIITVPTSLRKRLCKNLAVRTWPVALSGDVVPRSEGLATSSFLPRKQSSWCFYQTAGSNAPSFTVIWLFTHSFVRMPGPWRAGLSYWASRLCLGMLLNRTLGSYLQPCTFTPSHGDPRETKHEEWKSAELVISFLFLKKDLCGMRVHVQMCFCLILTWHLYNDQSKRFRTIDSFNCVCYSFVCTSGCLWSGVFFQWRPQGSILWTSCEKPSNIPWGEAGPQTGNGTWKEVQVPSKERKKEKVIFDSL